MTCHGCCCPIAWAMATAEDFGEPFPFRAECVVRDPKSLEPGRGQMQTGAPSIRPNETPLEQSGPDDTVDELGDAALAGLQRFAK